MKLKGYLLFRFACLAALWLLLCYILLAARGITPRAVFIILCSGGIVFIPLYKKYLRDGGKGNG